VAETITYEVGGTVYEPKSAWITITDSSGRKFASFVPMTRIAESRFSREFIPSENVPVNPFHIQVITEKVIKVGG
jgi:hypothetical protein